MTPRFLLRAFIGVVLTLVALAAISGRFEVTTAITHFMASGEDAREAELSRALAESELSRTMVFTLRAEDPGVAVRAAERMAGILRHDPEVASLRFEVPTGIEEAVHDLYFPRRFMFVDDGPLEGVLGRFQRGHLEAAARDLKRELSLPTGAAVKAIAPKDPWLLFPKRLEALQEAQKGALRPVEGHLSVEDGDGRWVVMFLTTHHSAFDGAAQAPLERQIQQAIAEVGEGVVVERSAMHRFAVASERSIRADVTRISTLSTVGIVLLFLFAFRSPRILVIALLPLVVGMAAAGATTSLIFGQIHGLTLAFGATLLGVCVDYPIHFFAHHTLEPAEGGAQATARRIWAGLAIGSLTSAVGFAALGFASFPGLQEMGVFATVGVLAALITTRLLLPELVAEGRPRPLGLQRLAGRLDGALDAMQDRRWALAVLPGLALLICVVGLGRVRWIDDTRALNRLEVSSLAEDQRVRSRVSRVETSQVVVASGADLEEALRRNDGAYARLQSLEGETEVSVQSLHPFLWSVALQRRNADAFATAPALGDRFRAALSAEGFAPTAFEGLEAEFMKPVEPLRMEDLLRSPLGPVVSPFVVSLGTGDDGQTRTGVLSFLRGAQDVEAVRTTLEDLQGVELFDQHAFMERVYREYRTRTLELVGFGLLGVLGVIAWRYRRPRVILAAFVPAVIAATTTLALLGLAGVEVHLLHLVALLLVLSMGVDYGVFLAESSRAATAATLVGLVVACLSTVLGFGLLALSSNPAMQALGYTTGIGVVLSLVFAPVALILRGKI